MEGSKVTTETPRGTAFPLHETTRVQDREETTRAGKKGGDIEAARGGVGVEKRGCKRRERETKR